MRLFELEQQDLETGYYDPSLDIVNQRKPEQIRKKVLTLRDLNKLKKMRAIRRLDKLKKEDLLAVMYSAPEENSGGGMGF